MKWKLLYIGLCSGLSDWNLYRSYIGIMEKKMETAIMGYIGLYRGYIGIMEL